MYQPKTSEKNLVVYVDDDPDDLQFVKESLLSFHSSLTVETFSSPAKAFEFLLNLERLNLKPCLVILDINMPGISGRELLMTLRGIPHYEKTPIILFTTSNSASDEGFSRMYGAGFLTKPMNYMQMQTIAEQFLEHCTEDVRKKLS